jgi:hypothetical protein
MIVGLVGVGQPDDILGIVFNCIGRGIIRFQRDRLSIAGEGLVEQGNRVNVSRCDEACQEVVIPCGGLAPAAQGVLSGRIA